MHEWRHRIDISAPWEEYNSEDHTETPAKERKAVVKFSKEICSIIKKSSAYILFHRELDSIMEKLGKAKTESRLNNVMNELYDWADVNRCWIKTLF